MKNNNIKEFFLNERLMNAVSIISVVCGVISVITLLCAGEMELLVLFEKVVKIIITILTLRAFSKFHWDAMQGLMGGLLFALLYQEGFLVLERLWGATSDFDAFLIMGVQGSLYLSAQSMSFLMTIIIILNHFIIDYSRVGSQANVIFNQLSIVFKILLYVSLAIINIFLDQTLMMQLASGFEYLSDLCIIIMVICIESQLDDFKVMKQELLQAKKERRKQS